ncbi:bacteriophage antitermination protein Q [Rahnella aceris]|uniref:bacteriophage antitermination protein Q n=1 Tax=Rahnella sp. (strain Y9602) TaxID=2703885 RepID=UPI001C26BF81|nr:bacteriophage antitermination protein Q [Rahnella aceris]MBU9866798.1 antitermination protein [Rahnella aceris]
MTQHLEYVRAALKFALMDLSGGTKGQLQAFSENPPADKNRLPRQLVHTVQLDGGRSVRAERTPTHATETRTRRRPAPPMNEFEFSSCAWRRAVNTLPGHQNSWIRYCYGADLKFQHQETICKAVWDAYQKHLPAGLLKKTQKRLISMVWLAAQDVAAKNKNDAYKEYAGAALATLMSISRSTWCEIYAEHWRQLKAAFEALDAAALSAVLRRVEDHVFEEDSDNILQNRTF